MMCEDILQHHHGHNSACGLLVVINGEDVKIYFKLYI